MKKDEKSVTELAKAYADAEKKIRAAASKKSGTVKEYKDALTETVMLAVSRLAVKSKTFAEKEIPAAFSDGQKSAGNHAPENHTEASAGNAANILKNAGFRYAAKVQGYDAYIELQNATQAAGKDFLSRVNAVIGKLSKEGKDAVYSVSQAVKEDIEKQGLLNVEYKGGRKVSLSSYAAMAARSARIESANIGTFGRALENGTDYVKCTEIYPTCEICAKYQGKIYCISGKDKRFPALFETALRHGYALMHPNCRHEFVPVWLETMSGAELAEMIEKSKISPKADTRSEEERNAYAAWQAKQRQIYHERLYFEQAKQRLGKAMPYESIAAFRRSYRTAEDTFAHKRSHNLIKDYKEYNELKAVLQGDDLPKTLAEYQKLRYNNDVKYEKLLREKQTLLKVKEKGWSEIFTAKAIETFYRFKKVGIEFTDHGLARFLSRKFTIEEIVSINDKPFNYYQDDGKKVKFYDNIAVIYDSENNTVISVMERKRIREDWHEIEN
nr:MAG TPA: minor capsid protein [Caudoviricetes sp.]